MNKLSFDELDVRGKRVLVRVDFNVPVDDAGNVTDDRRIRETLPTIRRLSERGAKAILMSHFGRPKGKRDLKYSLKPAAEGLSKLLGKPVPLAPDCIGPEVEALVSKMRDGDVLLLENVRFHEEEEKNDPKFAGALARLGDLYVNDAFGSAHRAHASTEGVTKYIEVRAAGDLMKKELEYLGRALENPRRPFVAIIGGAKISGKIDVIQNLLPKVDSLLVGGGMMFTFYKARGWEIGDSLLEEEKVPLAKELLEKAGSGPRAKLVLPVDALVAKAIEEGAETRVVRAEEIPPGWRGVDIGTASVEEFRKAIRGAKTVVWNGPMGIFEIPSFAKGTRAIAEALVECTEAGGTTVVGGGDSAAALYQMRLDARVSHVSTGGGASLEFLEGKKLPGVEALSDR
ncbi:MAG: phosphoglycerate kinase [Planctomycetota bacterium]